MGNKWVFFSFLMSETHHVNACRARKQNREREKKEQIFNKYRNKGTHFHMLTRPKERKKIKINMQSDLSNMRAVSP